MLYHLDDYQTLIFDFGGVIFDIDPDQSRMQFAKIFGLDKLQILEKSGMFMTFEKGLISRAEMIDQVDQVVGRKGSERLFIDAWNAMLLGYKKPRIEWLAKLRKTHQLIMLSNTNELHFSHFSGILVNEYGLTLYDLFDHVYLSHEMHLVKPDLAIFKQIIEEQKLDVTRTLFIEDTAENALAAGQLGIKSMVIPRNGTFYEFFS